MNFRIAFFIVVFSLEVFAMNQVITQEDFKLLERACHDLENPSFTAKLTNLVGKPIEKGLDALPENMNTTIMEATHKSLEKALEVALYTIDTKDKGSESTNLWHKFAVAATGGVGGFAGLAGLAIELPISTTIMLRSIADIARAEGEDLNDPFAKLACLEVFALGGNATSDDGSETGYYVIRTVMARAVAEAMEYVAEKGIAELSAPVLVRLLAMIAKRFSIQITQKFAAQLIPVIGAVSGAVINTLFIDHFQTMAKAHFCVRRLERRYGKDMIKKTYDEIKSLVGSSS